MKTLEIYKYLDEISPFNNQESWDNSGVALDNYGDCKRVVISLDIDETLVNALEPNSCLIIHHPLIFKPLKTLASGHEARLLLKLAAKNCSLICAHTNFDKSHLNDYLCQKVFGWEIEHKEEFINYCKNPFSSLDELAAFIKSRLNLEHIKAIRADKFSGDIAICCGAGASMAPLVYEQAGVYLTGDVKYHEAIAAKLNGLNMLDITHFASEKCFEEACLNALKDLPITTIISPFLNPFADI